MPRSPDAAEGPLFEEAIYWEEQTSEPADDLRQQYVQDKGLVIREDGVVHGIGESRENIWQGPVDDRAVNSPPGTPATGYRVIVGGAPSGAFVGHPGEIAQWNGSAWVFTTPRQGTITTVKSENEPYKQTAVSSPWVWELLSAGGTVPPIVAFSGYDSSGGTSVVSGWTDIPLDTERKKTSDFTHSASSAEVTVDRDDTYIIALTVKTTITSGTSRSDTEVQLMLDTGSGYAVVPGSVFFIYNRTLNVGESVGTHVLVMDLSDGDKLKMQARRSSGSSTLTLDVGSELVITTTRGPQGPEGPAGTGLPDATEVGQFLFSYDGATFVICKPVVTNDGFIVTDEDGNIVVVE